MDDAGDARVVGQGHTGPVHVRQVHASARPVPGSQPTPDVPTSSRASPGTPGCATASPTSKEVKGGRGGGLRYALQVRGAGGHHAVQCPGGARAGRGPHKGGPTPRGGHHVGEVRQPAHAAAAAATATGQWGGGRWALGATLLVLHCAVCRVPPATLALTPPTGRGRVTTTAASTTAAATTAGAVTRGGTPPGPGPWGASGERHTHQRQPLCQHGAAVTRVLPPRLHQGAPWPGQDAVPVPSWEELGGGAWATEGGGGGGVGGVGVGVGVGA